MEEKLNTLAPFFEEPNRKFGIRELARILKVNHTTIRKYLLELKKEKYVEVINEGSYSFYKLVISKKMQNLKKYYNLNKILISGLVEDLEKAFDYPVIVLFGSYASAIDDSKSDVDLCIISNIEKEFSFDKYERIIKRKVELQKFTKKSWERARKMNPNLVNNICNGLVLSGELEVL